MIKANGYGHEDTWVAREIENESGICGLGVATFEEGIRVRGAIRKPIPILVFSDCDPWNMERLALAERYDLTPVLSSTESLRSFLEHGHHTRVPFQLKFNTGMNRLGLDPMDREYWLQHPALFDPHSKLTGVLSHLHSADRPQSRSSRLQARLSSELFRAFKAKRPQILTHLGNSTALLLNSDWKLDTMSDAVRPGIALYGVSPLPDQNFPGIQPVMKLYARILQIHQLHEGNGVGYAHRYHAKQGETIATVAMGYADGLPRSLSEKGSVRLGHVRCPILGRVSMDLISVGVPQNTRASQWVTLWDDRDASIWELAQSADTIPYELWTKLTDRVRRTYE